jgi:hypothetical protein
LVSGYPWLYVVLGHGMRLYLGMYLTVGHTGLSTCMCTYCPLLLDVICLYVTLLGGHMLALVVGCLLRFAYVYLLVICLSGDGMLVYFVTGMHWQVMVWLLAVCLLRVGIICTCVGPFILLLLLDHWLSHWVHVDVGMYLLLCWLTAC